LEDPDVAGFHFISVHASHLLSSSFSAVRV
jgi:hypothetical protein